MKSVIVEECGSLSGLPTVLKFLESGWKVLATTTSGNHFFEQYSRYDGRLKVYALSLTDSDSIQPDIGRMLVENGTNRYPSFSTAQEVAETVLLAANDPTERLRYTAGDDFNERLSNVEDEGYLRPMEKRILRDD